jgi:hypothetical protein
VQVQADAEIGPPLAHRADAALDADGVAQPMVSASETSVIVSPASAATSSPSATVRTTCSGVMSPW